MLPVNPNGANSVSSAYIKANNNFRSSTRNLTSNSSSGTTDRANVKIDQLIRSESGSATKSLQNTESLNSSSQTENSSAGKTNDQVSTTNNSGSGELNLYTAFAKLKGSTNSQSVNSAENISKNQSSNAAADESETSTTNSSSKNLVGQLEEVVSTLAKARENLNAQKSGNSGRMEETKRALLAYEDNVRNAETKVRDIDMASETTFFTRNQVLNSSSSVMLSQSNQINGNVLNLIG